MYVPDWIVSGLIGFIFGSMIGYKIFLEEYTTKNKRRK
jgi:hypothetical protein